MGEQLSYIHCWGVSQGSRSRPPASTGTLRYTPPVNVGKFSNCTYFIICLNTVEWKKGRVGSMAWCVSCLWLLRMGGPSPRARFCWRWGEEKHHCNMFEIWDERLDVWGPVVQWLLQRFRSERLRVRSRRSATFSFISFDFHNLERFTVHVHFNPRILLSKLLKFS